MAYNKILLKRRNSSGGTPSIEYGELAWNQVDEKLYIGTDATGGGTKVLAGEGAYVALDPAGSDQTLSQSLTIGPKASGGVSYDLIFKEQGSGDKSKIYQSSGDLVIAVSDGSPAAYIDAFKVQDGTGLVWAKNGFETGSIKLEDDGAGGKLTATGTNGGVKLITTGTGTITLDADSAEAGVVIDAGSAGVDVNSAGTVDIAATGTSKAVNITSNNDVVLVTGKKAGAGAVKLNATATDASTTIDISSAGTGASAVDINSAGGVDIDAAGTADVSASSVVIDGSKVGTDAVKLKASGGTTATLHLDSTGTGTAAVDIDSAGGVDIDAAKDIAATSTERVVIEGQKGSADAVKINASGTNGGVDIDAKQGGVNIDAANGAVIIESTKDSAGAIQLNASASTGGVTLSSKAGGVDIDAVGGSVGIDASGSGKNVSIGSAGGKVSIAAAQAVAEAVKIAATGAGAATQVEITSVGTNDTSTIGDAPIYLSATGGGIALDATKDITLEATTKVLVKASANTANAVYVHADGGTSETIKIHSDQGTGAGSVEITSDAGGVDINAGTTVAIDSTGAANLTSSGADVTVKATAKSVNIQGGEAAADAVKIDASNAAGGVDVNAGTGGVTIDTSGSVSIDAATNSNITTSTGNITVDGKTGVNIKANGVDAVTVGSDGDTAFAATGGNNSNPDFGVAGYARFSDALEVDNIKVDGNAITSINTNGNIDLTPSGTGEVNISKVDIDDGTIDNTTISGGSVSSLVTSKGDTSVALSGTVEITSGSKNVTGTTTAFSTELAANDAIEIGGNVYVVDSITSNTALVLTANASTTAASVTAKKDPNLFKVQTAAATDKFVIDKSGNVDVKTGSLTIGGDLVVNGTTTTVNSSTISVDDNILSLGDLDNTPSAASSNDFGVAWAREVPDSGSGFETKFGGLVWDESTDQVIVSDDLGTSVGAIATINSYADFRVNHIRIGSDTINRDVQWQKIYDEIWASAVGDASGTPADLGSAHQDKILMVKRNGSAGSYTYDFELTDTLDGGTW